MTTTPPETQKILFVCLGNICRSPAAEGVMQKRVEERGLQGKVVVDSAATSNYHTGQLADPRMRKAATVRGYELLSKARTIVPKDLRDFDMIIAMDRDNYRQIHRLTSDSAPHVHLLSEFLDESWPKDVPDPYHGDDAGFDYVIDMLEMACPKILDQLIEKRSRPHA